MDWNFGEQQALLDDLLGDPNEGTDDAFPTAKRKEALNAGEIQFCADSLCVKEYATGTIASLELDVPSDYLALHCLIINDYVITKDREIPLHKWRWYYQNATEDQGYFYMWEFSGTKKMKFLAGSGFNGKTYKLFYFKHPTTDLDIDADESIIPKEFRKASVYYAAHRLLRSIGQNTRAAECLATYSDLVNKARERSEKEFMKDTSPVPDMGVEDVLSETDRQGQGHKWG